MTLCTIKRSADFKRVRGGARWSSSAFVVEARRRPVIGPASVGVPAVDVCASPRFGFTITRKIGNAVVRNRVRRRFKELARELAPKLAAPGTDYVVVARSAVVEQSFADMKQGFETALAHIARKSSVAEAGQTRARSPDAATKAAKPFIPQATIERETLASGSEPGKRDSRRPPRNAD